MDFLTANASLEIMFDRPHHGQGDRTGDNGPTHTLRVAIGAPVGVACCLGLLALLVWLAHKFPGAWTRVVQDLRGLAGQADRIANRFRQPATPPGPPMASPRNQTDEERLGREAARVLAAATAAECPERAGARSEWV